MNASGRILGEKPIAIMAALQKKECIWMSV
jgi:hypothetical protein